MPFYAAQPIIKKDEQIYAHEVFHRTSDENRFPFGVDQDAATSSVLFCLFGSRSFGKAEKKFPVFVNFSSTAVKKKLWKGLDPQNVVVELLETSDVDGDFIACVHEMKYAGFKIAIDDYSFESKWEPLLNMIDIIKFDAVITKPSELVRIVASRTKLPGQLWLAEKVEDRESFNVLRSSRFDLFQGFLWGRPTMHEVSISSESLTRQRVEMVA